MLKNWWKALSVLILCYVFIVGFLIPLKPGVVKVAPAVANTGDTIHMEITGYNSHFSKAKDSLQAWLKFDTSYAIAAKNIQVKNDRQMVLEFTIPKYLPVKERVQFFTLILDNEVDGYSIQPDAIAIRQDSINAEVGVQLWSSAITGLHPQKGATFPFRNILYETIRNLYYHVALWFPMLFIFIASVIYSIRYLKNSNLVDDTRAKIFTQVGLYFGIFGLITGSIWAKNAWGAYWSGDIKQNMTAIALLIYLAYFVLRRSFQDFEKAARISAVYNIFAFVALIPLIYVIPRMTDSLHPGAGGNISFGSQDLDNTMRMVFYPAIIGWSLLGFWMAQLLYRAERIKQKLLF